MKLTDEQRAAFEAVVIGTSDAEFERDPLGAMERLFAAGIAHAQAWRPIASAPQDEFVLILAGEYDCGPGVDQLPAFVTVALYDEEYGWCVDELRQAVGWLPLPPAPEKGK